MFNTGIESFLLCDYDYVSSGWLVYWKITANVTVDIMVVAYKMGIESHTLYTWMYVGPWPDV